MATIVVKDANDTEIGQNHVAMIGGREQWALSGGPDKTVSNVKVQFSVMGAAVNGYTQTEARATIVPFAPKPGALDFYWSDAGAVTVTITGKVDGKEARKVIEVSVKEPNVIEFSGSTSVSEIFTFTPPGREQHAADEAISMLRFGNNEKAGISFQVKVGMPKIAQSTGKLSMLQLMKVNRTKTAKTGGKKEVASSNGAYVLDQEVNYGFTSGGKKDRKTLPTEQVKNYTLTSDDSPGTTCKTGGNHREYSKVEVCEDYRMCVMFKPEGGIWVVIGEVDWVWHATADFGTAWTLTVGQRSTERRALTKNARISQRLPEWSACSATLLESDH